MSSVNPRRLEWLLAAIAIFVLSAASLMVTAQASTPREVPETPLPATPTPRPEPKRGAPARVSFDLASVGAAVTTRPAAILQTPKPGAPVVGRLRAEVLLPVYEHFGPYLRVLTPCEAEGWINSSDTKLFPRATGVPKSLEDATILLDPGHGGLQAGAKGPAGLMEKDANLAIAWRLATQLEGARVFMTRYGDMTAGLRYRVSLANTLRAHALVSIHNNSAPDGPSAGPGTETWHQSRSAPAYKLAGLLYGELVRELKGFNVSWVSDRKDAGTRTRLNAHGHDYYGLLRASHVPTVIVEAMFISNAPEEALLRNPEGQEAVAKALARSLKAYVKSAGPEVTKPYTAASETAGGVPAGCSDPS